MLGRGCEIDAHSNARERRNDAATAAGRAHRGPVEGLVSVSIVTFNSEQYLPSCLAAVRGQSYSQVEVIVVDNASTDRSAAAVGELLPPARVIRNRSNLGFAAAHNQAIRASAGELVLVLNPDVRLTPRYLEHAVSAMASDPAIGTVAGKLLLTAPDDAATPPLIDSAGLYIGRSRRQGLRGHGQADRGQYDRSAEVFGACGAAPLYRRAMLDDVAVCGEVFDADFFIHKEDVDLAWRARVLGWRAVYEPRAVAHHPRHFRPGMRSEIDAGLRRHAVKNRYLTIVKNDTLGNLLLHLPWVVTYDIGILGYLLLRERSSLPGLTELIRLLPGAVAKRRAIQRRRRLSSRELRRLMRGSRG